jgi:hypothetical protein
MNVTLAWHRKKTLRLRKGKTYGWWTQGELDRISVRAHEMYLKIQEWMQ